MTSQMRGAVSSIGSNIDEGGGEGATVLSCISCVSHVAAPPNFEYQLLLARDLDWIPLGKFAVLTEQVSEVRGMLTALIEQVQPVRI